MKGKIIEAPEYIEVEGPMIFLAGPIQGADDWQKQAIAYIQKRAPEIHIASPRRDYFDFGEPFIYNKQVDWETHYLRRAAKDGVILFWLANEFDHACERAYAQTTRFELGEWKSKHESEGTKLVIGIDKDFTGAKYIRRRIPQDCPDVPILNSLEETCDKAIEQILK